MTMQTFDIAPPSHSIVWDHALTIAFTPAVTLFGCVAWFTGHMPMATISALVAFGGTLLFAIPLARPRLGRIALSDESLDLDSGFMHARLPLTDLQLADAHVATGKATPTPSCLRLTTSRGTQVAIPRRDGSTVLLSPVDPAALVAALHARATA